MPDEVTAGAVTPPPATETPAQTPAKTEAPATPATSTATPTGDKPADGTAKTLLGEDDPADGKDGKAGDKPADGTDDGKPKEGEAPKDGKEVVPEKYDVKVPEGMDVDTGLLDALTPTFKELGLSQEKVQKLVDKFAPAVQASAKAQHDVMMKQYHEQIEGWGKETRDMLGAEPAKALAPAAKFISTFAGKEAAEFRSLLNETGLGNHPLMVKVLIAAGKALSPDGFVDGGSGPMSGDSDEATVAKHYPSMHKR